MVTSAKPADSGQRETVNTCLLPSLFLLTAEQTSNISPDGSPIPPTKRMDLPA